MLFNALSHTTSSVRRAFEKSLLQNNIVNLSAVVTVLKNELDLDLKLSCTELIWRALRRTKEEASEIVNKIGCFDCTAVEELRCIAADNFEVKKINFMV